ncbi:hypothetical protein GOBAR_AA02505 [Gossypium barbadense]|uniref:Uncharacterized protein n=1 Tax=Gossypium barbadense TaxID=3634 RepID=A0A2P5YR88_GOSBA|nr:hypothetical protein GOBAR_AA02505 [Gossypium barbadense]
MFVSFAGTGRRGGVRGCAGAGTDVAGVRLRREERTLGFLFLKCFGSIGPCKFGYGATWRRTRLCWRGYGRSWGSAAA